MMKTKKKETTSKKQRPKPSQEKKGSSQYVIRLDKTLLERIKFYAGEVGVEKAALIKQAIEIHLDTLDEGYEDSVIEDYVHCRISETAFREEMEWDPDYDIPNDLKEARKEVLEGIKKKQNK